MRSFKKVETFTLSTKLSTQVYLREVSRIPVMTPDEEYPIALKAAKGDLQAIQKLITANLRFVLSVAKMYASTEDAQQEMVAVGNVGLVDAAYKFDPTKGFRFISFAVWHIRKEMILYIQKFKRTVYVPPGQLQLVKKAEDARYYLFAKIGREATDMEVFDYLKDELAQASLTFNTFKFVTGQSFGHVSLDKPMDTVEDSNMYEVMDSGSATPQQELEQSESSIQLAKLLASLTETERKVVEMHHGVNDTIPRTYIEISEIMGFSRQNAELIHRKAIKKMKSNARRLQFEPEL
jgi:RNA polymerase primary sigma factor